MSSVDLFDIVFMKKSCNHISSKNVASPSCTKSETGDVSVWITPHKVCERSFMRDLLEPLDVFDITNVLHCRGQASMNTENLVVDYGCYGQVVKQICE